ncbi:prepilin-type N-terminal cleavage/methylation domain-containing protein [bacterium]|nr:prepilin-type N-terminal cleavage/methylation domain-containing protein [bacterium]
MDAQKRTVPKGDSDLRRSAGFTLIEMTVALVVAGIVMMAVLPLFKVNLNSYVTVQSGKQRLDMTRVGFNRMIAEMRRIQNANDVLILGDNQVQFDCALYRNGDWYTEVLQYTYDPANHVITRSNQSTDMVEYPLLKNVQAFSLKYLDKAGVQVTTSQDIYMIQLSMTVGTGAQATTYTQEIHPKIISYVNN